MLTHDHLAAHEFVHRWWFAYDEGHLEILDGLVTDDCHLSSRTETGQHPYEQFIASDNRGRPAAIAWTKDHRRRSPYPLRHNATNVHIVAERHDEIDLASYLFVTEIAEMQPRPLSSGIVHWTLRLTAEGYRLRRQQVVLDSITSDVFENVDQVKDRIGAW